ncbi:MAG: protein-export membrane protein SecF [Rhodanobacter sp. 68-29]|uniref:protein translocase subunit SecF n=1 Tax=Rhodanobacter sp. PCA2 TaxID=2006117 RepID=UPI00086C2F23|nr:protein translocase subunit SecF [Rhodanobacter sp. PCA2]MBA2078913.1 protein translocase subunit SecF [Rhodanobacter sp. PCA2]MBN8922420.1 protein translocase subunit SecF [Rhodanobacter sp.]ODU74187.1 MAG: protein-export membrane protein SecF [Rhodanobacter sp. SCN 69-32]OJY60630.1 MAG: protein-export membrane protein SecF [Rhodanobacter sp. 68-29]
MEIFNHNSNIHFLRIRVFSVGVAIVLMIASAALIATKGLNYALDFTGGVSLVVDYAQPVQTSDVHDALEKAGLENPVVQSVGGSREVSIRMQPTKEMLDAKGQVNLDKVASTVMEALKASRNDATLKSRFSVSAEVGAELKSDGMVAAVFVILGIMAYLWIRFERRFAIAAVLTEIHDTLVTLGVLALVQREFDMTVLASVLAVIGYSINDKVVVFDRIRELFRLARKAEPEEILNRSINSTLSRTIITSLFTGITMAALFFFGGPAVHNFAITMLIGIVVGTLSSIFVASPILLWLGVSKKDLMPVTKENPELARRP